MRGEKWKSINSVSTRILNGPVLSMGKTPLNKQPQQTPGAHKPQQDRVNISKSVIKAILNCSWPINSCNKLYETTLIVPIM